MKILNKTENKLFNRNEVTAEIEHSKSATPSSASIVQKAAESLKSQQDLIAVKSIHTSFGDSKSKILIHVYKDKKDFDFFEKVNKKKKSEQAAQPAK